MEFNIENPLTHSTAAIPSLFLAEPDHMTTQSYTLKATHADICFRRQSISSISKFACKLDPFISYLAVNYLDRFLSSQTMPLQQGKTWVLRLIAISCVSLAAKLRETEFSLTDFQRDGGFVFDVQAIERMEYAILGALKWRMRSITPFSFISFFTSFFKLEDPRLTQALNSRAVEIIFKAQTNIKFLEFKPSIVAASALLSAYNELFPSQFPCYQMEISSCLYVHKENLLKCYNWMEEMGKEGDEWMCAMVSSCSICSFHVQKVKMKAPLRETSRNDYPNNQRALHTQVQRC